MNSLASAGGSFSAFMQDVIDKLSSAITSIAAGAGLLLQHLWIILTRQQLIIGLQQLLVGIGMLVASGLTYKFFRNIVVKNKKFDSLDKTVVLLVGFVVVSYLVINGFQDVVNSLPHLLNPEYYALQESVKLLQQVKQ